MSAAAAPALFDITIQDESPEAAYAGLQQAVAALSPAVRTKLQGLPADVLDYADLIASSSVQQPVLKPVFLAGEKGACSCVQVSQADMPCMQGARNGLALALQHWFKTSSLLHHPHR